MDNRLKKIKRLIAVKNLDAIFISSIPNITYLTNFSGFSNEDRDAFLLITKTDQYIFTHGIYKEAVKKAIKNFKLIQTSRDNPTGEQLEKLIKKHKIKTLGFESADMTVFEYENLFKNIDKKNLIPALLVEKLRLIKDKSEIEFIKKACQMGDKIYSQILSVLKTGVTEKRLAYEIENLMGINCVDPSFATIVAFGENAAHPHHKPTNKRLKKNTFILMDFGVKLNNYCSDMTRTIFFGKADSEQKKAYETVLTSQNTAIELITHNLTLITSKVGGPKASSPDKAARDHITKNSFPTIPHSLGHGIGLQVHENPRLSPNSKDKLAEGMVFSIEPGIYLQGKFGIRIEDIFAIQNNKLEQITHSPRELVEI